MASRTAVVVGAGVFGACLAFELVERGWTVTIVDAHTPGHVRASSGGESRIMRCAHGADRWYMRSAWRALAAWKRLEEVTGSELLVRSGAVWFAHRDDGWEAASEQALRGDGIPVEHLSPDDAKGLFPNATPGPAPRTQSLATDDLAFALYEPDAGVLRARRAVEAITRHAVRRGAKLIVGQPARPNGSAAVLGNGARLQADCVVWACGAWLARLFPGLVDLRVTKQDVTFFGVTHDWTSPPTPAWVDYDGAAYGAGDIDGRGFKCAPDVEGPAFDPDADAREPSADNLERARSYLRTRFPALAGAPLLGTRTCQYALTPDTNFVLAPLPDNDDVWLLGGGSGHGFKHGPSFAAYVADVLEGSAALDQRFGLGQRKRDVGLRTAGGQR